MELILLGTAFALATGTTLILTPIVSSLAARRGWLDNPDNTRKLHLRPIPAVGGVAILAGIVVGVAYLFAMSDAFFFSLPRVPFLVIVGLLAVFATGFYDDIKGLGFKSKFVVQVGVGYLLLYSGYSIDVSRLPFIPDEPYTQALISIPLTLLWVVGTINAVNLIDGLDGLAAGVVLIIMACLGAVFAVNGDLGLVVFAFVAIGALLGFLAFNFNPATVFMGDAGSLSLGYVVAVFTLSGETSADPLLAILVPVVALGFPLLDAGLAVFRRLIRGVAIFAPDRDHIHHRLSKIWPQWRAVLALYAVTAVFGVSAIVMSVLTPVIGLGVFGITVAGAGAGLALLGYLRVRPILDDDRLDDAEALGRSALKRQTGGDGLSMRETSPAGNSTSEVAVEDLLLQARQSVGGSGSKAVAPSSGTQAPDSVGRTPEVSNERVQLSEIMSLLSRSTVVRASEHLSIADLGGEAVVLDANEGRYYGLNAVGARIVNLVQQPRPVSELVELVVREFGETPENVERDVIQFLQELADHALVHVDD